jgi:hypothetical protein
MEMSCYRHKSRSLRLLSRGLPDGDNLDYPNASNYHISTNRKSYINGVFPQCSGGNLNCGGFSVPQVGQEGNEKQNQFRNPGFAETDLTIKKITNLTE